MTGRIPPDGFDPLDSASDDGLYLVQKDGARFREWYRLVEGDGIAITLDDTTHEATVEALQRARLLPLTTVVNGVPELVWDADNQLVFAEVPE